MITTSSMPRRCAILLTLGLAACSGAATGALSAQQVTVTVSPDSATLRPGAQQGFVATVSGTADQSVTWSIAEGPAGGAVTPEGAYTAPPAPGAYHLVATSNADPARTATATITVSAAAPPGVTLSITPSTARLDACQTYAFAASVTGASNTAVAWSVREGSAGGTVSATGVYTAPSTAGTYHVVAASQADWTKQQTATVTVAERIVSVSVSPATYSVAPGGTVQFTATVTTTCGSFTSTQAVAAAN